MALLQETTIRTLTTLLFVFSVLLPGTFDTIRAEELRIGRFLDASPGGALPPGWEPFNFPKIENHTVYTLHDDEGRTVIKAESRNAASGLICRRRIDPNQYPYLRWRWKIDRVPEKGDVTVKRGDDCAARLYVAFAYDEAAAGWWERLWHRTANVFAGKELPGSALTYIWASRAPEQQVLDNPYAGSAKMIVLQSGNRLSGQWVDERRNVFEDYQLAFGRQPTEIIGIGIMTDTDNTGEEIVAYYGEISLEAPTPSSVPTD